MSETKVEVKESAWKTWAPSQAKLKGSSWEEGYPAEIEATVFQEFGVATAYKARFRTQVREMALQIAFYHGIRPETGGVDIDLVLVDAMCAFFVRIQAPAHLVLNRSTTDRSVCGNGIIFSKGFVMMVMQGIYL